MILLDKNGLKTEKKVQFHNTMGRHIAAVPPKLRKLHHSILLTRETPPFITAELGSGLSDSLTLNGHRSKLTASLGAETEFFFVTVSSI